MEISSDFTFALSPQWWGIPGICVIKAKRQFNENLKCRGKRAVNLPTGCPAVWGFWQGFAGQKVKLLFPGAGWGRGYR